MKKIDLDTLQTLYAVTKTPLVERIYPEDIIRDILTQAAGKSESRTEIILFILRMVDAPENLAGSGHVGHFIGPLLSPFLQSAHLNRHQQDLITTEIQGWVNCLTALPDVSLYFSDVTIIESPIFRFHLEACGLKKSRRYGDRIPREEISSPSPLYRHYAPLVHLRMREFIRRASLKENPQDIIDEHIRSARMFFTFMSHSIKYATDHPRKIPEYYINHFVEEYDRIVNGRISCAAGAEEKGALALGERAAAYRRYFCSLMKNDYTLIGQDNEKEIPTVVGLELEEHDFTKTADSAAEIYGQAGPDDIPENLRTLTLSLMYQEEEQQDRRITGIEAPLEEELIYLGDENVEVVKKRPRIRRSWTEFTDMKKYFFYWDSSFLNLYSYSRLYQITDEARAGNEKGRDAVISAFLMLLIHTGLRPLYLIETHIGSSPGDEKTPLPVLRKERDRFDLVVDLPISARKTYESSGCLFTYPNVTIPILFFLRPYVEQIFNPSKNYLFSIIEDGREIRVDLTMVRAFLKAKLDPFGLNLTPESISYSFLSLYSSRFGMDPIVACYVSKNHNRIFNAPLHYIFVPKKHLFESYSHVATKVHRAIKENMKSMAEGNGLRTPVHLMEDRVFKASRNERGYGSPQIPERETWFGLIHGLRERIKSYGLKSLYKRHNLYSIYLYMALMLATSLRPRNNPEIAWDAYNSRLGIMILAEKLSPKFYEERVVPVSERLGRLIDGLRDKFGQFSALVDDYLRPGFSDLKPQRLFFFLNENYEQIPFELREIRKILAEEYISFPLPLNTPRHYIRSSFYWDNIHHELSSLFMGHQTSGKEWLTEFSSVDISETFPLFSKKVDAMFKELNFETVPYLPRLR